jgi:Domain of unknown function (DUF4292)
MRKRDAGLAGLLSLSVGCARVVAPPASSPPTADAALGRMHATLACANAVQAGAKVDHFGERGRVRVDVLLFAARPDRVRVDVVSSFGVALATLTSDGQRFALADMRERRFYSGPASACNIARLTTVPVPVHVLVELLRGEAPVLRHTEGETAIAWSPRGYWVLTIPGTHSSHEEIHLAPRPQDWSLPWQQQRMRVLDVRVEQQGYALFHAELDDHAAAPPAPAGEDPDHIGPPSSPSGPPCNEEIPRKIRIEVSHPEADVRFSYEQPYWNPPLPDATFEQTPPAGEAVQHVTCE